MIYVIVVVVALTNGAEMRAVAMPDASPFYPSSDACERAKARFSKTLPANIKSPTCSGFSPESMGWTIKK